jgi:hypothetical protein
MTTTTSGSAWTYEVKGSVRLADGSPATGLSISAADRDLRSEQPLGQAITGQDGAYYLQYDAAAYAGEESISADLVVKAHGADGSVLAASPVLFNAPPSAVVDLTIPAEALQPPSRFEVIGRALQPLLDGVTILRLEEDAKNQDMSLLAGKTGLDKTLLARFILAHRLAEEDLPAELRFGLLGGAFYQWTDGETIAEQLATVSWALASLDEPAVRKALARGLAANEIAASFEQRVPAWVEAFAAFVACQAVGAAEAPSFLQSASIMPASETLPSARRSSGCCSRSAGSAGRRSPTPYEGYWKRVRHWAEIPSAGAVTTRTSGQRLADPIRPPR